MEEIRRRLYEIDHRLSMLEDIILGLSKKIDAEKAIATRAEKVPTNVALLQTEIDGYLKAHREYTVEYYRLLDKLREAHENVCPTNPGI